jgi:hypothetical protein
MKTIGYESKEYKLRLYISSDNVLLLDIFINNPEKYRIYLSYNNNILYYRRFKIHEEYYRIGDWKGFDVREENEELIDVTKINLNKIFTVLQNYDIYNAEHKKNIIMVGLMKKDLLKEYSAQIDENKISIRWNI